MASSATAFRYSLPYEPHFEKLLASAEKLSYDPNKEIDWTAPLDATKYGLNPEWSSLYGTKIWKGLSETERIKLTRHEVASIMSTGIWFESLLQSILLRAHYSTSYQAAEFQWALTELADECRHSIMFARICAKLEAPAYRPGKVASELGRGFRTLCTPEQGFAGILVAEEVLDIMQRDWMRGEEVLDEVKIASKIHVTEEARHMKFARIELQGQCENMSRARREFSALVIAIVASVVMDQLVVPEVYRSVGLRPGEAKLQAQRSPHRKAMLKLSAERLTAFLDELGLVTNRAYPIYRGAGLL